MNKLRSSTALVLIALIPYLVIPFIFRHSDFIKGSLLFMNYMNAGVSQPEELGIKNYQSFRLSHSRGGIQLGAWHILPKSKNQKQVDFADTRPIVLYVHGNGGSRASSSRGRLYRKLAYEHDYHIVTFDYAGYGDSTNIVPTADGMTKDAEAAYKWILSQPKVSSNRIIVWGHSLGTAVATRMVAELSADIKPRRLILEAPFDTLANAVSHHPFAQPFKLMPYFEYYFVEPMQKPSFYFNSTYQIMKIKTTPIMILHADDDRIIPSKLGKNLHSKAVEALGESNVKLILLDSSLNLGHKDICTHDATMNEVKSFINDEL